jgi:hypothetical protein
MMTTLREHIRNPKEAHTPVEGELISRIKYLDGLLKQSTDQLKKSETDRDNLRLEKVAWQKRLHDANAMAQVSFDKYKTELESAKRSVTILGNQPKETQGELDKASKL